MKHRQYNTTFIIGNRQYNRQYNRQFNRQYNTKTMDFLVLTVYRYLYAILEKGIVPNWWQGIYDQLLSGIRNRLFVIFNIRKTSANSWTCQLYYYACPCQKLINFKIYGLLRETLTTTHWIRLSLVCRWKWTRTSQVSGKMFRSNI